MGKDLIIVTAGTGSRFHTGQNPFIPYTVEQVIADMQACYDAGSRYYHYHTLSDAGDHISIPEKYERVGLWAAEHLPDMRLSFATSRGGKVNNQVQQFLNQQYGVPLNKPAAINSLTDEQFLAGEMVRAGCLTIDPRALPYSCTTMTGAEIRIAKENETGNSGYLDPRNSGRVGMAYEHIARTAAMRGVVHEVEMTTYTTKGREGIQEHGRDFDTFGKEAPSSSFKVLMDLAKRGLVATPLSIVLLIGFSDGLPLKRVFIEKAIDDASAVLNELGGKGWITLGSVITPAQYEHPLREKEMEANNLNPTRLKVLEAALARPEVKAIRIGIEDAPWWREGDYTIVPQTNQFFVEKTAARIRALGGRVITDPKEVDQIIGAADRSKDPIRQGGNLGDLSAAVRSLSGTRMTPA